MAEATAVVCNSRLEQRLLIGPTPEQVELEPRETSRRGHGGEGMFC